MMRIELAYDSQDLKKPKTGQRGWSGTRSSNATIFRIVSGIWGERGERQIVVRLHSSVSRGRLRSVGAAEALGATELHLNRVEAHQVVVALLAAMNKADE